MPTVRSGVGSRNSVPTGTHKRARSGKSKAVVLKMPAAYLAKDSYASVRSGGIGLNVEVHNTGAVMQALAARSQQLAQAAYASAVHEAEYELELVDKVVPRATGALAATGRIEFPDDPDGLMTVAIAYGDEHVDYAIIVHEDMSMKHKPPTKAKYLEEVVYEEMELGDGMARIQAMILSLISGAP